MSKVMEEHLQLPMSVILEHMQQRILEKSSYFGIKTLQSPLDFWVYQELMFATKPDVLIEIGNFRGGSTLALAHLFDAMGHGRIIGLDIDHSAVPEQVTAHPRITLIEGDACRAVEQVKALVAPDERAMVIEDSSHTFDNTLEVLRLYAQFVKPGDYFIVEDGICHHGLAVGPSPGPYEAVEAFVAECGDFEIDRDAESFLITWNPKGYLKRKA
jgi:cephalosporin hydroxylase